MRILVIDGPNLNLVGTREPSIYGSETLDQVHDRVRVRAAELDVEVVFFQSNHEGRILDRLHERDFDGTIVNAGGLAAGAELSNGLALREAIPQSHKVALEDLDPGEPPGPGPGHGGLEVGVFLVHHVDADQRGEVVFFIAGGNDDTGRRRRKRHAQLRTRAQANQKEKACQPQQ